MKRIQFFCVAPLLLLTGTLSADLVLHDYLGNGEVVVQDTQPGGNYWVWDLTMLTNKTYAEQITAIAGLGTYGNIAGGWHMASLSEMSGLWSYSGPTISAAFNPVPPGKTAGPDYIGRYDQVPTGWPGTHCTAYVLTGGTTKSTIGSSLRDSDTFAHTTLGAWVTTDAPVVPAPGALVLAATGLLSVLGVNRCRRKS